jgi:hypothetical protein
MLEKLVAALSSVALLAGCAAPGPETYREQKPALDLLTYFDGTVEAWGQFADRSGEVVKRFKVTIRGRVEDETLVLDEQFSYSDGSKQRRVWTIRRLDAHRYAGTAADVVGEARGELWGNALRWRYVLALEIDGKVWNVDFDDWMYLHEDGVMLNRSEMSKFGVRLGEVMIAFRRRD